MSSLNAGLRVLMGVVRYHLQRGVSRSPLEVSGNVRSIISRIRDRSYVVVPDYLARVVCDEIICEIDRLIQSFPDCMQVDAVGADHRIFGSQHGARAIMGFHNDRYALEIGHAYCGSPIVNFSTLAAKLEARPGNVGSGQGWHRDRQPQQFKAIVYLTDVTTENGPFQIIPGSHRTFRKLIDTVRADLDPGTTRLSDAEVERILANSRYEIDTITGKAGSMILVDTSAIHRGMPIVRGTRYALTNYYYFPDEVAGREEKFPPMLTLERVLANANSSEKSIENHDGVM